MKILTSSRTVTTLVLTLTLGLIFLSPTQAATPNKPIFTITNFIGAHQPDGRDKLNRRDRLMFNEAKNKPEIEKSHLQSLSNELDCEQVANDFPLLTREFNHRVQTPENDNQNGATPSIALADNRRLVEVHKAEFLSALWYSVGIIQTDSTVAWKVNERINIANSNKNGQSPDVAISQINDIPIVVQVNKAEILPSLWYNLGQLNSNNTISWHTNAKIKVNGNDKLGEHPAVATSNERVIQVNESNISNEDIWFNTGKINGYQIEWQDNNLVKSSKGVQPDVALLGEKVIVVYREYTEDDDIPLPRLHYTTGTLNSDGSITWESLNNSIGGQLGLNPTVAVGDNGVVIEMHLSPITSKIWVNVGVLEWPQISWKHNCIWDSGISGAPQVAYNSNENLIAEIHAAAIANLWVNIGKINDYKTYVPIILR